MIRKLGRFFVMAAVASAFILSAGRMAQASVTVTLTEGKGSYTFGGANPAFASGDTYYIEVQSGNLVVSTDPSTFNPIGSYDYKATITTSDNAPNTGDNPASLSDNSITVATGNQNNKKQTLTITISDDGFTSPTGKNLNLLSSLSVPNDMGTIVSATGEYIDNSHPANHVTDTAGADNGQNVTNKGANTAFTLTNTMTFNMSGDAGNATADNLVTLTSIDSLATPEPSTIALAISGFCSLGLVHLRRRRAAKAAV